MSNAQLESEDYLIAALKDAIDAANDEGADLIASDLAHVLARVRMASAKHPFQGQGNLRQGNGRALGDRQRQPRPGRQTS